MKNLKSLLVMAGCMAALLISTNKTFAQRPNFDPAQFRQMRIDSMKDKLSVTNDDEWKLIEVSLGKVSDAQMEVISNLRMGGPGGGGRRRNNNNDGNTGETNTQNRARGMFGTPSPEMEELNKALEDKAPVSEIKDKLAKLRESTAAKEAKLTAAQEDLKKLLTARQEAIAVVNGFLK